MKSLNSVTTLAIAAALIVGVTGCKHQPKPLTSIPRYNQGPIKDDLGGPVSLPGPQNRTGPGNAGVLKDGSGVGDKNLTSGNDLPGANAKPIDINDPKYANQNRPPENSAENRDVLAAETVLFDYDRSSVKSSEVPKVQRVATYLKNQPTALLRVEGNCDERGTEEYNRSLGERRALAVRELLIASGVAPDRVSTVTFGEDKPADPGHDEAAWAKNRRADFVVLTPGANTPIQ